VTTAEQPPPEGDEQPPQATEGGNDSDAPSPKPTQLPGSDTAPAGE
jgi:hypothetical protein